MAYTLGGAGHSAVAVYSNSGSLLASQTAGTSMCGGCVMVMPLASSYTLNPGTYYIALSTDASSGATYGGFAGGASLVNPDDGSYSVYVVATAANTVNWASGAATWPPTLGALTKNNNFPVFSIGY
jgi:hypothetical protein